MCEISLRLLKYAVKLILYIYTSEMDNFVILIVTQEEWLGR